MPTMNMMQVKEPYNPLGEMLFKGFSQGFQTSQRKKENQKEREFATEENQKDRSFRAGESQKRRTQETEENVKDRDFRTTESQDRKSFDKEENKLDRELRADLQNKDDINALQRQNDQNIWAEEQARKQVEIQNLNNTKSMLFNMGDAAMKRLSPDKLKQYFKQSDNIVKQMESKIYGAENVSQNPSFTKEFENGYGKKRVGPTIENAVIDNEARNKLAEQRKQVKGVQKSAPVIGSQNSPLTQVQKESTFSQMSGLQQMVGSLQPEQTKRMNEIDKNTMKELYIDRDVMMEKIQTLKALKQFDTTFEGGFWNAGEWRGKDIDREKERLQIIGKTGLSGQERIEELEQELNNTNSQIQDVVNRYGGVGATSTDEQKIQKLIEQGYSREQIKQLTGK